MSKIITEVGVIEQHVGSKETDVDSIIRAMHIMKSHGIQMNVYAYSGGQNPYIHFYYEDKLIAKTKAVCFDMKPESDDMKGGSQ